jgi:hypothetical protein
MAVLTYDTEISPFTPEFLNLGVGHDPVSTDVRPPVLRINNLGLVNLASLSVKVRAAETLPRSNHSLASTLSVSLDQVFHHDRMRNRTRKCDARLSENRRP